MSRTSTGPDDLPLPIDLLLPSDPKVAGDWSALPRRAGVFLIEDERGRCLGLSVTSDLRRLIRSRLEPADADRPTRRIEYRSLARRVRATTVGSAFEADCAFLQLSRRHLPGVYRSLLDRWQAWFVHCDPASPFPQWVKTAQPGRSSTGPGGTTIGPFPDKHVAGRYAQLLEDAFDLCRYHHVLVQSPHGAACAYKEMGRCPAPCDGSVPFDAYRRQVMASADFASAPIDDCRTELELAMDKASDSQDFEEAARLRRRLDATKPATRPAMRRAGPIEAFQFLAVMPGERPRTARLFTIRAGRIDPWADVPADVARTDLDELLDALRARGERPAGAIDGDTENIGLVCHYLFKPARRRGPGRFLHMPDELDRRRLGAAIRQVASCDGEAATDDEITEQSLDDLDEPIESPASGVT